jgi:hypothetical protein
VHQYFESHECLIVGSIGATEFVYACGEGINERFSGIVRGMSDDHQTGLCSQQSDQFVPVERPALSDGAYAICRDLEAGGFYQLEHGAGVGKWRRRRQTACGSNLLQQPRYGGDIAGASGFGVEPSPDRRILNTARNHRR